MATLVLFPPGANAPDDAPARWVLARADGSHAAEGMLAPGEAWGAPSLGPADRPERAVVLLPAEDVFAALIEIPAKSDREAAQAAPFLIEERLAGAVEDTETAAGPKLETGERLVLAADRGAHQRWRGFAAALGVKPLHALPDAMAMTGHGGDLTVAGYGERILFQTREGELSRQGAAMTARASGDAQGVRAPLCGAMERDLAAAVLPAVGQAVQPERLLISPEIDPYLIAPSSEPIALKRAEGPDLAAAAAAIPDEALARLPALFGAGLAAGLDWLELLRPWRVAAALALAALAGWTALTAGEGAYYAQRAEAYRDASEQAFRNEFPEVTRVVNARAQLSARIAALGGGEGADGALFLELVSGLAAMLEAVDQVSLTGLRYDAERGALSVTARYADFAGFESLRQAARERGLSIEDGGARQTTSGVTGEFTLSRGGAR